MATGSSGPPDPQGGAVAVEFALVLPLLLMFLFGVIQYGYGLFQLQSFGAALDEAGWEASTGVADCTAFDELLTRSLTEKGLSPGDVGSTRLEWLDPAGRVTDLPQPSGQVRVTATYRPLDLGLPGIPFPRSVVRSSTTGVQSVLSSALTGCAATTPRG
ncbi:pilus assembly protein [Kineosporia sp. J2-2]|uniref:Pilus assembly protein n=1 Tax=Kineosporia corallincola TaxID=2835133 RepID=A0ABS5TN72_9ACTN|nr:TadE/TadG family type IV pilus assembly protein [Kineosporia corallincola]MBT0771039.1 pilus assembly protein [Kineosporia corallincola]